MYIELLSDKDGDTIHNRKLAKLYFGLNTDILVLSDLDDKFTPIQVDGFGEWHHAVSINGKSNYFCESI